MHNRKDIFYFKKFAIKHSKSAMKVGFDGILLGAWCDISNDMHILDVGTGTGLIAMMISQRNNEAKIRAIEPDIDSYFEAKFNFEQSPWSNRLFIYNKTLQDYTTELNFDHIVCNPPFFVDSIKSAKTNSAKARHTIDLKHIDLLEYVKNIIDKSGKLSVILPYKEGEIFLCDAKKSGFYLMRKCEVYTKNKVERLLITLSLSDQSLEKTELLKVYESDGYSGAYIELVKDFYLKM